MIQLAGFKTRRGGNRRCQKTLLIACEWLLRGGGYGEQKRIAYENGICPKKLNAYVLRIRRAAK